MKTKNTFLLLGLSALTLASAPLVHAQNTAGNNGKTATTTNDRTTAGTDDAGIATGDAAARARANQSAGGAPTGGTRANNRTTAGTDDAGIASGDAAQNGGTSALQDSASDGASNAISSGSGSGSGSGMAGGSGMDARAQNAQMLIRTLSEEKTEINTLAAQQAQFQKLGGRENLRLAAMWGRWIREHKAAGPALVKLIQQNGGDPMAAKILKAPVLGPQEKMLDVTHKDHEAAVMTSQMRYGMTNSNAIKTAMRKRATLARKHIRQMAPYHAKHNMMEMDKRSVQG